MLLQNNYMMSGWVQVWRNMSFRFSGVGKCFGLFWLVGITALPVFSQERCGIVEYNTIQLRKNLREDDRTFERWISSRISDQRARLNKTVGPYKIPVVFHVIHNGEAVGDGTNLSQAQIISQLKVLNTDFKRLNADTVNTPGEFASQASGFDIEFMFARQSPEGAATTGIVRKKGAKTQWSINDNSALKATSYWPAEDYLNIWVTDIATTILGYAQFPVSDLAGLEDAEDNRLTDGVVLDYRIVGSSQDGAFNLTSTFNRGRTATHEVGHFFGLRHIWGDDEGLCSGSGDYVSDTPNQGNSTDGCPSHPLISCTANTMFQNYMDYTNDVCMNLYTEQQVDRMITVIQNSPRRTSLLSSHGLYDPAPVANDLAILEIRNPSSDECSGTVVPTIVLENMGTNQITSAQIQFTVNNVVVETKDFTFAPIQPWKEFSVSFSPWELPAGNSIAVFKILKTNFLDDGKSNDNEKSVTTMVPQTIDTPFHEPFDNLPSNWTITNPEKDITWMISQTGQISDETNTALLMKFFNAENAAGEKDILVTPVFDLSEASSPFLTFDVAYAKNKNFEDGLEVYVLLQCKSSVPENSAVYSRYGSELATTASTAISFVPTASQWRKEVIDLRAFIGQTHVQLAFVAVNDNGNNLYIDNIAFSKNVSEDVAIKGITDISPVSCTTTAKPSLLIENDGIVAIQNFKILYTVNNGTAQEKIVSGIALKPGEVLSVEMPSIDLLDGENSITYEVVYPNGFVDVDPDDNQRTIQRVVNEAADIIPLRKHFDTDLEDSWVQANPSGTGNWQVTSTNYGQSLYFAGYNSQTLGDDDQSWFVSPVLNLSNTNKASVFFDLSFHPCNRDSIKDPGRVIFQILASKDCGETFDEILFSTTESMLTTGDTEVEWKPSNANDWTHQYINLSSFAGEENVRIAFVINSNVSNNLYLDNIEFFMSDDPSPFSPTDLYKVYGSSTDGVKRFYISFNLEDRQPVAYELVDVLGRVVGNKELSDVLNQTYEVDVQNASRGIYLVRLQIHQRDYVSRILIGQ